MPSRISQHVRSNLVAYLALFFAVGGTAMAVDGPNPGQNTIGSEDIIGNEVKSDDIGNGRIFNLDIADDIIQGGKIKDGTIAREDLQDLVWTTITPESGWSHSGITAECTKDLEGIVHLRGAVFHASGTGVKPFDLPPQCRPDTDRYVTGTTLDGIGDPNGTFGAHVVSNGGQFLIRTGVPPVSTLAALDGITFSSTPGP